MTSQVTEERAPSRDAGVPRVEFRTDPSRYRHWRLAFDGPVATVTMDVGEQGGLVPGYELKLSSYDLGVDIELHDAVQRLRFEHPEVKTVVVTSGKDRIFCAGANIRMLAASAAGDITDYPARSGSSRSASARPRPRSTTPPCSSARASRSSPAHASDAVPAAI